MYIPSKKKQPLGLRHFLRQCVYALGAVCWASHNFNYPPPPPHLFTTSGYNRLSATYETLREREKGEEGENNIIIIYSKERFFRII
jgi:hypothetical protein